MKYVLLLLFICGLQAQAQVLHIDSVRCNVDESDTSYINKMVRHEGQFYNHVFNTHANDYLKIDVNLYGSNRDCVKAIKAAGIKSVTNGAYSPELNQCFVYKNDIYLHVILKAVNNNLLHNNYPNAPRWLTEGLASVMAYSDENGERIMTYTPLFDYNKQIKDLSWKKQDTGEEGLDFDALFLDSNPDWEHRLGTGYGQLRALSYGIVYFLLTHDSEHAAPIIVALKNGNTAQEAIASSYGSFDEFKNRFVSYYRYAAKSKFSAQN